jgi:hypothetical protein
MTIQTDKDLRPKWHLLTNYGQTVRVGMRASGKIYNDDAPIRVDLYQTDKGAWVAAPTVGGEYWRSMEYPDLWTALRCGDRWLIEMNKHGFACDGSAPQMRALATDDYVPTDAGDPDCYQGEED